MLGDVPAYRWREILEPLHWRTRQRSVYISRLSPEDERQAQSLVTELLSEDLARPKPEPPPLEADPPAAPSSPMRDRQVNVRLRPEQYARLRKVAREFGLGPTQLARQLIVRGVAQLDPE